MMSGMRNVALAGFVYKQVCNTSISQSNFLHISSEFRKVSFVLSVPGLDEAISFRSKRAGPALMHDCGLSPRPQSPKLARAYQSVCQRLSPTATDTICKCCRRTEGGDEFSPRGKFVSCIHRMFMQMPCCFAEPAEYV